MIAVQQTAQNIGNDDATIRQVFRTYSRSALRWCGVKLQRSLGEATKLRPCAGRD